MEIADGSIKTVRSTVQYSTVQYSTVQYSTVQCSAVTAVGLVMEKGILTRLLDCSGSFGLHWHSVFRRWCGQSTNIALLNHGIYGPGSACEGYDVDSDYADT